MLELLKKIYPKTYQRAKEVSSTFGMNGAEEHFKLFLALKFIKICRYLTLFYIIVLISLSLGFYTGFLFIKPTLSLYILALVLVFLFGYLNFKTQQKAYKRFLKYNPNLAKQHPEEAQRLKNIFRINDNENKTTKSKKSKQWKFIEYLIILKLLM